MTTIQIDIDDVPTKIGNQCIEMTDVLDLESNGSQNFSIDVKIEPDGGWDITEVYPAIGTAIVANKLTYKRGKKMTGPFSRSTARFLETFAFKQISEEVRDAIMQAGRSEFPEARVV